MRAYTDALAGTTAPRIEIGGRRSKPGSVAAAVALYFQSTTFSNLAPGTQRNRRFILERFRESYGNLALCGLNRGHVERMLAEKASAPHAARNFLKALRGVISVAIMAGWRDDDPTAGVRNVRLPKTGGFRTWTEDEIDQFEERHKIGSPARLAFGLLLYTAQRRGDVIRMGRQHIKGGFISVRQEKTSTVLEIPISQDLQEILDAHPATHMTLLTTAAGKPFSAQGFTAWFRDRCEDAGLPLGLSAHGLRKAACRRLADAGCTVHQIAAISGHVSLQEIARYTRAADQKRLATDAMRAVSKDKRTDSKRRTKRVDDGE